ncbi:DUF938 domain-containing protein [Amphritea sp. HPY]|uniref:DUF938 domain-containing protein n=1 Tax=Amphritea sp. HPY TaxID=3421652 RepID=UPI003D7E4133
MLNYSVASERNQEVILAILRQLLRVDEQVLEIGSGSGQHSIHFCRALPDITWNPSELENNLVALAANLKQAGIANINRPLALDVSWSHWPVTDLSAVYTANTLHIVSWQQVEALFEGVGRCLKSQGLLIIYGPFRYAGQFTTPSNAEFDRWLRLQDSASGIRDFEAVQRLAERQGLVLLADHAMPANNQLLVWERVGDI